MSAVFARLLDNPDLRDMLKRNLKQTGKLGIYTESDLRFLDRHGRTKAHVRNHNIWHDEGEKWLATALFARDDVVGGATDPDTVIHPHYIGLDNRATPAEGDQLTDLSGEPSGNGYGRISLDTQDAGTNDWTRSQVGGIWQAATGTKTFTASGGNWTAVQQLFLCNVSTGTTGILICSTALSASRTLNDGDSMDVTLTVKFQEPTGV